MYIFDRVIEEDNITLREGLQKFYMDYRDYHSHTKQGISNDVKEFFKSHDIAHVLFNCDISLFGEGKVKIWIIFGTTLGFWNHFHEYRKANAYRLSKNFTFSHVLKNIFKFLYAIPVVIYKAKKMSKPWPWSGFEPYMDNPISEIRKEFNIMVV